MPFIDPKNSMPGIVSFFQFRPETGAPLKSLAQTLLRNHGTDLSDRDRELIAAYVSSRNECKFCTLSHAAAANHLDLSEKGLVDDVIKDFHSADISEKLKSLLNIAGKVQVLGNQVTEADIKSARENGANDIEIHDTVLIAAAFCMYNRYVDGLRALTPPTPDDYEDMGHMLATQGYIR